MILKIFGLILAFQVFAFCQIISAQSNTANDSKPKAELINSSHYGGSELESAYIDNLRVEMQNNPDSKGVFVFYCGKICKYGEVEAHIRGLIVSLKGKGWKNSEFAIMQGGYQEKFTLNYLLIPKNIGIPIPDSTIDIKDVTFRGTFKKKFVPYDCCG